MGPLLLLLWQVVEQQAEEARPLDGLTVGAVEARLAVLEEYYAERQKDVNNLEPNEQQQVNIRPRRCLETPPCSNRRFSSFP